MCSFYLLCFSCLRFRFGLGRSFSNRPKKETGSLPVGPMVTGPSYYNRFVFKSWAISPLTLQASLENCFQKYFWKMCVLSFASLFFETKIVNKSAAHSGPDMFLKLFLGLLHFG
jgi:hypothetical protein